MVGVLPVHRLLWVEVSCCGQLVWPVAEVVVLQMVVG